MSRRDRGSENTLRKIDAAPAGGRYPRRILTILGLRVMLDVDLAELYGVQTRVLNQAVQPDLERFPEDFMFQLSREEVDSLRSQFVTLKSRRERHRKYLPYAFTEQGVAMLSSVLNSEHAIQVNISIMRAFVALRRDATSHEAISRRMDELERKHGFHDEKLKLVFRALRELVNPLRNRVGESGSAPYWRRENLTDR